MRSFFLTIFCAIITFGCSSMAFVPSASRAAVCGSNKHVPSSSNSLPSCLAKLELRVNDEDDEVNVNLIPDVDAFTLTAVGFGLIAFNFFVLANMGDAGIAGAVARIINTFSD
ncbi:hypothetical protein ACHAXN_002051 [Cyclotella atomus]